MNDLQCVEVTIRRNGYDRNVWVADYKYDGIHPDHLTADRKMVHVDQVIEGVLRDLYDMRFGSDIGGSIGRSVTIQDLGNFQPGSEGGVIQMRIPEWLKNPVKG